MPKTPSSPAAKRPTHTPSATPLHHWHLATDEFSVAVTDLEYAVMRIHQSFQRYMTELTAAITGIVLSGQENILIHIIAMHDRPKTIKDLMVMTNRQDMPNMQYELRKLLKADLISKTGSARKGVFYRVTPTGKTLCQEYAQLRATTLLEIAQKENCLPPDLHQARSQLEHLEKIYEIATRDVATFHRRG